MMVFIFPTDARGGLENDEAGEIDETIRTLKVDNHD